MNYKKYELGDTVTIREWDDMLAEYGPHESAANSIAIPLSFVFNMKYSCGKKYRISSVIYNSSNKKEHKYKLSGIYNPGNISFVYTAEMFQETGRSRLKDMANTINTYAKNIEEIPE